MTKSEVKCLSNSKLLSEYNALVGHICNYTYYKGRAPKYLIRDEALLGAEILYRMSVGHDDVIGDKA